jgi:fumarate hydratase class II
MNGNSYPEVREVSVGTDATGTPTLAKLIDEMVGRSLMLVTALGPVIGYGKASTIAHAANDQDLTLKDAGARPRSCRCKAL